MSYLTLLSALLAAAGLIFVAFGIKRFFQKRLLKASSLEFTGVALLLLASSSFLLASNLYTYQRLVYEQPVAEVSFQQLAEQEFLTDIKSLDSSYQHTVNLRGDEWQLDTQVLSWRGVATLLGLDANYRLHRISGRYSDIEEERQRPRSVYSLVQDRVLVNGEEFDLWQLANKYQEWLHWVDAVYGSAVFLPMTDGARYSVAISRTGLIARPANDEARKAVSHWIGL